jgi:aminoglycoside 6-adenylyltransferase
MDYERVLAQLRDWALKDDDVRAVVMTGSGAAKTAHPLSDRDIEIYSTDVDALLADESWWKDLGQVLVVERLENPGRHPTRLVYYVGGKLDLNFLRAERLADQAYHRPFQVLVDKDGTAPREVTPPAWEQPGASEFEESLNLAYAAALMLAKAIVRGELWSAKIRDEDLKDQLLAMIEWDHRARYGPDFDTRYLGTRMTEWMDADVRDGLLTCWGHFDAADTEAALRSSMNLYVTLATRAALNLGLPTFDHDALKVELETILSQRPPG